MVQYTVHLQGGPFDKKGRHFNAEPAQILVIPVGDGFFTRYRRAQEQTLGKPLVYDFVEQFEGDRS